MRTLFFLSMLLLLLSLASFQLADAQRPDTSTSDSLFLPLVQRPPSRILIAAAYIDSTIAGDPDEAILLWNIGNTTQALAGWQVASGTRRATFALTSTLQLAPQARIWCTAQAATFRTTFLAEPSCEWALDSDPTVEDLQMTGKLSFVNTGGMIYLLDPNNKVIDSLLYGNETQPATDWVGLPAQLYTRGAVSAQGQVWQRKLDPITALPLDSDHASDWAGDLSDLTWGRRVRLPGWGGWGRSDLGWPITATATASVTVLVGPEGLYQPLSDLLSSATQSLDLSLYSFEHPQLAQVLANAAGRGVKVRLLLEGSPPGGITDEQKWCVSPVANAGGDVRYLAAREDAPKGYPLRYRYIHAKYGIIDGRLAFNGTDNFNYDSMPISTTIPIGGRRGFYLLTDAPPVIQALQQLFAIDWNPARFLDLHPFDPAHPKYGNPPADFVLPPIPNYYLTQSPFRPPISEQGSFHFTVISAPENALRPDAGLLPLIGRAGAGDEITMMQLYEHKNWGDDASSPIADPNPRLQTVIEAARRGASVRILLDRFFDDAPALRSNRATVAYLQDVANAENLKIQARVGNPTRGGIHAKLVLVRVGNEQWSAVGSLNGGEVSHKLNREVMVMVDASTVYDRLYEVFTHDWEISAPSSAN